jgi:ABC-type branched-subunit amino acid transport system permease subunit
MLVFGLVMMIMMVVRPQGLLPLRLLRFKESDVRRAEGSP